MKNLIILTFITAILITGCGFKIVKQPQDLNFSISKIQIFGEKRINYNIKSQILNKINEKKEKSIILKITTNKDKIIKEKNIKNEITKYEIIITSIIEILNENEKKLDEFSIQENGIFSVASQHSQSVTNEKKLITLLSKSLAEKIVKEILIRYNDI
tara:strand:+ start:1043 stop:1513 length:471 start_codon:yes stop_codon:yes gene_type:complete